MKQIAQQDPIYQNQGYQENIYVNQAFEPDEVD